MNTYPIVFGIDRDIDMIEGIDFDDDVENTSSNAASIILNMALDGGLIKLPKIWMGDVGN